MRPGHVLRRIVGSAGLVALSLLGPFDAAAGDAALVVSPSPAGKAGDQARDRLQVLTGRAVPAERTFGPDDLTAATGYKPVIDGPVELFTCRGPALDQGAFDSRLTSVVQRIDELDLEGAAAAAEALKADLPCATFPVPARGLHDVYFFSGLMASYLGKKPQAIESFAMAAGIKPDVPWNTSYAPESQQLYLLGKEQALQAAPAVITLVPPSDARKVWVDGVLQDDPAPREVTVRPGAHLVLVEGSGGVQRAVGLKVGPGASLWADPGGAVAAAEAGATTGPAGRAAEALLRLAAASWSAEAVYVLGKNGVVFVDGARPLSKARVPLTPTGDRFGLRLGGGAIVRAARWQATPFGYGAIVLDAELALLRGLELGASVAVGFTSAAEGTWSLLPTVGVGPQWAWSGVAARPVLGAEILLADDRVGGVDVGAGLRGGVRFAPKRGGITRIAALAHVGWVGKPQIWFGVTAGFGARPK